MKSMKIKEELNRFVLGPVVIMSLPLVISINTGCVVAEKPLPDTRSSSDRHGDSSEQELVRLAGQRCPQGAFVIGFDRKGQILCSHGTPSVPEEKPRDECQNNINIKPRAKLQLCNLSGRNLTKSNLQEANLLLANLENSNLSGANLSGAHLSGRISEV